MRVLVLLFFITAAVGYSVYSFIERVRLKKKNEVLRDRYRLLRDSVEKEKDSRRARYRISHESGKIDVIRERLQKKYEDRILTERKLLEEIILYEKERAELLSVSFDSEVTKEAEDILLLFSEDESIAFFLNLIDNALEAAAGSGVDQKKVSVRAGKSIEIINSKADDNVPAGQTSKSDAERHGFGLGIIVDMCKEKNLDLLYEDKGDELVTLIERKN